eukprot:14803951-Ditylum_brightwellii.AAC.1
MPASEPRSDGRVCQMSAGSKAMGWHDKVNSELGVEGGNMSRWRVKGCDEVMEWGACGVICG